ncbi:MAG: peptidoglycan DD-metalloendopeptidase family protein [Hyphomicrobiales bacterium]|nr:peptidoglycan DD-metalloendopeptidase family protein [Hyphomicrobiales bacterium]MDE2113939.1 LysM peptidoglycan-binding domain-containing M23 family metallopeptidase [Hyphomicrobiales bacterium]
MLLAGCSSDAFRFSNPYSNPFGSDATPTGSIRRHHPYHPAPIHRDSAITSRPLSAPGQSTVQSVAKVEQYHYKAPRALQYQPIQQQARNDFHAPTQHVPTQHVPAQHAPTQRAAAGRSGHWSAEGGTPIVVATGESAALLATRYGVPETDLLHVNGIFSAAQVQPGTRLVIPVYNGKAAGSAMAQPEAPTSRLAQMEPVHHQRVAAEGPAPIPPSRREKLARAEQGAHGKMQSGHRPTPERVSEEKSAHTRAVRLPMAKDDQPAHSAMRDRAPRSLQQQQAEIKHHPHEKIARVAKVESEDDKPNARKIARIEERKPKLMPRKVAAMPPKVQHEAEDTNREVAAAPAAIAKVDPTPTASLPQSTASANEKLRWPARGRIIRGFAPGQNDGINIAVPDGTSVHAVDGGVVAYAGNELKGYGNLVLIRHANGFVSAYANNGALEVKRGQSVSRGQVIAKSGQSGNVSSPQLHFELRKGATPVNPTHFLANL